jgi:hypothetical protein
MFAALGCALGYRFHTTRAGYAALALMALLFPLLQIADVILVPDRNAQTMLPLLLGVIMVLFTIVGAGMRTYFARR